MISCAMPTASATERAPCSSPVARAGETAVTARARSPSARAASAATSDESTPPENDTTALPRPASRCSSLVCSSAVPMPLTVGARGRERTRPPLLDRPAGALGERRAVVVLGRDVDQLVAQPAAFDPHLAA